ncbi:hypothetical protein D9757_015149 [Collybiopsis confluens]|uniref:ATP-dependent DNA helicase n=1 Tax=Collybiopsis confluens TaxID=2823264 RepID=A0A8H5CKR2_9AGAR|nr:hypothetical protein D9757_015149 [Collybiopsis confluens]
MSTLTVTIASLPVIAAFDSTLSFSVLSSQLRGSFQFAQTSPTVQATVTVSAPSFASTTVMTLFFHPCPDGVQAVLGNDFAQCCYRALLPSLPSQLPQAPVGFSASLTPPLLPAVVAFPGYHPGYIPPGPTYWPVPFPMAGSLGVIPSAQSFIQGHTLAPALEHSQSFDTPAPTSRGISWQADSPSNQMQGAGDRGTSITAGTSVSAGSSSSTPHKAPTTRELIEATLFANGGTGVHCSAFSSDHGRLVRFCHNHGMDVKGLHSISQCRNALLHHVLNGHCFISRGDHSAPACHHFSVNCNSRVSLLHTISEALCTAGSVALPTSKLVYILDAIGHREVFDVRSHRREIKRVIKQYFTKLSSQLSNAKRSPLPDAIEDIFQNFERLSFPSLTQYCRSHRIPFNLATDRAETLRELIAIHIVSGECYSMEPERDRARGCRAVTELFDFSTNANSPTDSEAVTGEYQKMLLSCLQSKLSVVPLRRVLTLLEIDFPKGETLSELRVRLKKFIDANCSSPVQIRRHADKLSSIKDAWPTLVPESQKQKYIDAFRKMTSSENMVRFTCASCAAQSPTSERIVCKSGDIDMSLLNRPDMREHPRYPSLKVDATWLDPDCSSPHIYTHSSFPDCLLHPLGIHETSINDVSLSLCKVCSSSLRNGKTPPMSMANHLFVGDVPDVLKGLSIVEEAMISRCRAKSCILRLKEEDGDTPITQRGFKGNVIIYPQRPEAVAKVLPPSLNELSAPICIIFIGSNRPSTAWLQEKAKPLSIRPGKVRAALVWLKQHNHLYKNLKIDHELLDALPDKFTLPVHVEYISMSNDSGGLTAGYDPVSAPQSEDDCVADVDIQFESVVITDIDTTANSNELRAAAVRHVKNGGAFIEAPHGPVPVNEFFNPTLFPLIYPTLYPYGLGGFESHKRSTPLSMKRHVKHLLNLHDRRFQEHPSFPFTVFNILQRRSMLLRTSVKAKKSNFEALAARFAAVTPEAVSAVATRYARGDHRSFRNAEEQQVLQLMNEVNVVTSSVSGSAASLVAMRNQIRALMMDQGLPSFYVTINPADIYNPLLKFLAGGEIDIDNLLPSDVPNSWDQSILIAKNPVIASGFFNIYMNAFIKALLGYDGQKQNLEGGVLGVVKAYYGCIEAQGRGSLHCHMLIWVEGGLNPNEIKKRAIEDPNSDFCKRLIVFLEDTITNSVPPLPSSSITVPSDRHHPCALRGTQMTGFSREEMCSPGARQKDLHNVVQKCQVHTHTKTCYKYCVNPTEPKECRFGLGPSALEPTSYFSPETGELTLRCLDGLVNNFNRTIIEALHCNMDIKFVGSGASAKAVLYYITNYITKTQLKTHVAFAALARAVAKLGECDPNEDVFTVRAKKLLQKCAYAMISQQELSAQQVCTYLLDLDDHFTSHQYANLFWLSFESVVEKQTPSIKCGTINNDSHDNDANRDPNLDDDIANIEEEQGHDDKIESDETLNRAQPHYSPADEENEIRLTGTPQGELVPSGTQVDDYVLRSSQLEAVSLWKMIASYGKVAKPKRTGSPEHVNIDDLYESDNVSYRLSDAELDDNPEVVEKSPRGKFKFLAKHPEAITHWHTIFKESKRKIPVPIGPPIPRRDKPPPWRHAQDLLGNSSTWSDAFDQFTHVCDEDVLAVMENMQILHECRDSKDDHFTNRATARRLRRHFPGTGERDRLVEDDILAVEDSEDFLLDHLLSIDATHFNRHMEAITDASQCLDYAEISGMFDSAEVSEHEFGTPGTNSEHLVSDSKPTMEQNWKETYSLRKEKWRQNALNRPSSDVEIHPDFSSIDPQFRSLAMGAVDHESMVYRAHDFNQRSCSGIDIDEFISEINPPLNTEQERAFRIIASHSQTANADPLRMFLGGEGGTGKSHVINALRVFYERQGEGRRFRLASYTGVAAKNISGMTLHSALNLAQSTSSRPLSSKSSAELMAMWSGVDYLFIDEISMVGCRFLLKVSRALNKAKDHQGPFGNINIIVAGDFAQLGPVGDPRLYSFIKTNNVNTTYGQECIFGKLLWLSIRTVVILTEVMRQTGQENKKFVELLQRLRTGTCTGDDYSLLDSRVISRVKPDWERDIWKTAPIIVSSNRVKDLLNERAAASFAERTGRPLHWYYACDTRSGEEIQDDNLNAYLIALDSGKTNQRLGRIPLVIGMPVILTQNYDVSSGIVNGCCGTLKSVRYRLDGMGRRHALSCVIESDTVVQPAALPGLDDVQHIVALEDKTGMTFVHPHSKKKCTFQRTQVPLAPAFAMTAHKAQGRTLAAAIVDIESCRGTESPYVMISRVKSLDGLLILRPFQAKKIQCRASEDSRREARRLEYLRLETISFHGNTSEANCASSALKVAGWKSTHVTDNDVTSVERLSALQAHHQGLPTKLSAPVQKRKSYSSAGPSYVKRRKTVTDLV